MTAALSLLGGVVVWEAAGWLLDNPFLPPFSATFVQLVDLLTDGDVLSDVLWSVQNLVMGFTIAVVAGIGIGLLMARIHWIEEVLDPYVYGLLTAPAVVFVPVYFTLFGLSRWAIVMLIVQYAMFIIVVNTVTAVKSVNAELIEMAQVFGARGELQLVRKIVMPAAMPLVFAGVRLGMGRAVKGMINGELLIAVIGLGGRSSAFGRSFNAEGVLAVLLIVVLIALAADRLVQWADQRLNGWLPATYR